MDFYLFICGDFKLVEIEDDEVVVLVFVLDVLIEDVVFMEVFSVSVFWKMMIVGVDEFISSFGNDDLWFLVELLKFVVVD